MGYPFPGNIRELENIIERSVALESSSIILPENLIIAEEGSGAAASSVPAGEFRRRGSISTGNWSDSSGRSS